MSRSGYCDDGGADGLEQGAWRGQVASALRGKRGQRFLRDLIAELEAMPEKRLIAHQFDDGAGGCCAAGAVARRRAVAIADLNPTEDELWENQGGYEGGVRSRWNVDAGKRLDVAWQLIAEVESENDSIYATGDEDRWRRVRAWAERNLRPSAEGVSA